jgi:hypothetical protein
MLDVTSLFHERNFLLTWRSDEVQDSPRFRENNKVWFPITGAVPFARDFYNRISPNQVSRLEHLLISGDRD